MTGCARTDGTQLELSEPDSKMIPVADFIRPAIEMKSFNYSSQVGEYLYYVNYSYQKESQQQSSLFYRKNVLDDSEPLQLLQEKAFAYVLEAFVVDYEQNYYCLLEEKEEGVKYYCLEKRDREDKLVYSQTFSGDSIPAWNSSDIYGGIADAEGNLCLYSYGGVYYFFDAKGGFINRQNAGSIQADRMADAGDEGIYLTAVGEKDILFYPVDMQKGIIDMQDSLSVAITGYTYPEVFSGYEDGIYLSMDNRLWKYRPKTNEKTAVVEWDNSWVNINDNNIEQITPLETGGLLIAMYDWGTNGYELAAITWQDETTLPERKTITLGVVSQMGTESPILTMVRDFNRQSKEWKVEILVYGGADSMYPAPESIDELKMQLLQGNGPDLIQLDDTDIETLSRQGVFEDLEPYFEKSHTIQASDLLDVATESCYVNGKQIGVLPWFMLEAVLARADEEPVGWTYENVLDVMENQPEQKLERYIGSQTGLLNFLFRSGMESFLNIQKGTCSFKDERFTQLLERVNAITLTPLGKNVSSSQYEVWDSFLNGEYTILNWKLRSMDSYLQLTQYMGDRIKWIGWPSADGEPVYLVTGSRVGINSASQNKEGAWAFLEFMLSDQSQTWGTLSVFGFPARKDNFQRYLRMALADTTVITQEDIKQLEELVDHGKYSPDLSFSPVDAILNEECAEYFAGKQNAEDTADIIQNRVQLYLDELK